MLTNIDVAHEMEWYLGVGNIERTKEEIEECVIFVRLELYNRDLLCGPQAIRKKLEQYYVIPLPSQRTIARILERNGLTHRRTGIYGLNEGKGNDCAEEHT